MSKAAYTNGTAMRRKNNQENNSTGNLQAVAQDKI